MYPQQTLESLNQTTIESFLSARSSERMSGLEILQTVDSTNSYLLEKAKTHHQSGLICLAEEQTRGRGRQGKEWYSPKGMNIYASVLWYFSSVHQDIAALSLAVGVMVVKALRRAGIDEGLQLKWPNDIYFADRKLAGILIEAIPARDKDYPVVIGLGLNLQLPATHPLAATSIGVTEIAGVASSRNQLAGLLLDQLLLDLPIYTEQGFAGFLPEWRKHDMLLGKSIRLVDSGREVMGVEQGINEAGELLIRDQQGKQFSFRCGEVSIKQW